MVTRVFRIHENSVRFRVLAWQVTFARVLFEHPELGHACCRGNTHGLDSQREPRLGRWGEGHGDQAASKPAGEGSIPSRPAVMTITSCQENYLVRPMLPRSEEHTSELQSLRHLVC